MDPIKILKRAWQILWSYRALWVFGVILALTVGGAGGGGNGGGSSQYNPDNNNFPGPDRPSVPMPKSFPEFVEQFQKWMDQGIPEVDMSAQDINTLIFIIVVMIIGAIVLGIIGTIFRYVAETALIRMVDEHERTGEKPGVRQGFRWGWSRTAWRLFLINLLVVGLPGFGIVSLLILIGIGVYLAITQGSQFIGVAGTVAGIGIGFLLLFLGILLAIVVSLLRNFFWRACALDDVGVIEAIRRGYAQARRNWKNVGLMWLIMIGLGIAWGIALFLLFFLMIPVLFFTGLAGALVGALPGLLAFGIASLFVSGPWTWIIAALVAAPLFLLVFVSPFIFLRGLEMTFVSTVWTLTYRELKTLENAPASLPETPALIEPA